MAGPIVRTYKAGSIIYFDGDAGEDIYVLQKGVIVLIAKSLDLKSETKENVHKGEFFGVKSALGRYKREETAQVLADSIVLVFKQAQFENLCLKNTRIVLQMLKVFSANLRQVHAKVREILGEMDMEDNSIELIKVAEYYYKQNILDQAEYVYKSYLHNYPQGKLKGRANKMLESIGKSQPYPLDVLELHEELDAIEEGSYSAAPISEPDSTTDIMDEEIPEIASDDSLGQTEDLGNLDDLGGGLDDLDSGLDDLGGGLDDLGGLEDGLALDDGLGGDL